MYIYICVCVQGFRLESQLVTNSAQSLPVRKSGTIAYSAAIFVAICGLRFSLLDIQYLALTVVPAAIPRAQAINRPTNNHVLSG